jgi:DNA-binding response OmpR family regulator
MNSQPIIIVGGNNAFCATLKEALLRVFENVDLSHDIVGIDPHHYALAIGVVDKDILASILRLSEKIPMIAMLPQDLEVSETQFEAVFRTPLRLGKIVDYLCGVIADRQRHENLAPISFGDGIIFDPRTYSLRNKHLNKDVRLTEKEAEIILYLSKHLNEPVVRQKLLDGVWGYASDIETHTLETHVYRLRQKLKIELMLDQFLVTKDEGYILNF